MRAGGALAVPPSRIRLVTLCLLALHAVAQFDPVTQLDPESPLNGSYPLVGRRTEEVAVYSSEAAELAGYPADRSECDTRDIPCMAGTVRLGLEFELMMKERPVTTLVAEGMEGMEFDKTKKFAPPDGTIIDYSGSYNLIPAPYETPETYESTDGSTTFVTKDVVVRVTPGSFEPAISIVQPGSTITFLLDTFETVHLQTLETPQMTNLSFDSGKMNHNWGIKSYVFRPVEKGLVHFDNIHLAPWEGRFSGSIFVTGYNCSFYTTCTSCLIYEECIWCGGNGTCVERNVTSNNPYDTGVVVTVPYVQVSPTKSYEHIKYMEGYNTKTVKFELDWYPWPPVRKNNPRPVDEWLVPAYFEPTESDGCTAYFNSRDAAQCPDYKTPPPLNRATGIESEDRPNLPDFFACYEHVRATWSVSDVPEPVAWKEWPVVMEGSSASDEADDDVGIVATALCCSVCSSCDTVWLNACNISCPADLNRTGLPQQAPSESATVCPTGLVESDMAASIAEACNQVSNCSSFPATAETSCQLLVANQSTAFYQSSAFYEHIVGASESADTPISARGGDPSSSNGQPVGSGDTYTGRRLETEYVPIPSSEDAAAEAIRAAVLAAKSGRADWGAVSIVAEAGLLEDLWAAKSVNITQPKRLGEEASRRLREEDDIEVDEWTLIPKWQQNLFKKSKNIDLWSTLYQTMRDLFGHRCNATTGCDRVRGDCLNISGLPIIDYDQNGTCTCHPWFTADECNVPITDTAACLGMGDDLTQCGRVRDKLYTCGVVSIADGLPTECVEKGLDVLECGDQGYLQGTREEPGVANEIGRPEQGYASSLCAKCISRGDIETGQMRPETYAKTCSRPEVLHACQRMEDATNQRICNYCTEDTQGSNLPGRGNIKACSFFRGTCMGAVEQRIRGVVPPNADIIGHNEFGGLRYCKRPAPFTMQEHYLKEDDIMQVGQACIDHTAHFTNWDFTRQKEHKRTVKDDLELKCASPNNARTCPYSRRCVRADLCPEDNPDFTTMPDILEAWGTETLISLSDQGISGEAAQAALEERDITYTFNTHKLVLNPETAYTKPSSETAGEPFVGNWPYLWPYVDQDYMEAYTKVTWSVGSEKNPFIE